LDDPSLTTALKPLPAERYSFAEWKRCTVAPDYHTSDRLIALGLSGMAKALDEQRRQQCSVEGLSSARARVGSPVRSVTRPVAMIDPFFTTAYHDCSMRSP
jgi:hypothetical protein